MCLTLHRNILPPKPIRCFHRYSWNSKFVTVWISLICWPLRTSNTYYLLWQYRLSSFQAGYTKLERFLPKNQHTRREWLNFENWCNGEVSKSGKIWLLNSIFYIKNHQYLSNFFSIDSINLGAHFLLLTFFNNINF